jgi:hypothetical protein
MCCKPLQYSKQKMNEKVDGYLAGPASRVGAGPGDPGRLVHRRGRSGFVTSRCGRLLLRRLGHAIGRQQGGRRHDPDVIMLVQREWKGMGEKKGGGGYAVPGRHYGDNRWMALRSGQGHDAGKTMNEGGPQWVVRVMETKGWPLKRRVGEQKKSKF